LKVIVACEFSAIVRDAFGREGHDAWSCDIRPTEGDPKHHYQMDIFECLEGSGPWDLMIAHPSCQYLANSGVRWLYSDDQRWKRMIEGGAFFRRLLEYDIPRIAVENPVIHNWARMVIGRKADQVLQPWMFGDNETKAVCLWLKGLHPLEPWITDKPENVEARVHKMAPGPDREKERSRFFPGMARAMAEQWGRL